MKRNHLFVALAVLLVAGGLWLSRSPWRTDAVDKSTTSIGSETSRGSNSDRSRVVSSPNRSRTGSDTGPNSTNSARIHRPPNQTQVFRDFTPEERVKFARKGHGPGG